MLAFAVVVVGGVMIAEPLRAVAHFSHCPHGGGECQKTIISVNSKKQFGAEKLRRGAEGKMSRDAIRPTLDTCPGSLSTLLALDVLRLCSFSLKVRFLVFFGLSARKLFTEPM